MQRRRAGTGRRPASLTRLQKRHAVGGRHARLQSAGEQLALRALLGSGAATLAALLADAGVELGALLPLRGLPSLLANLGVEGGSTLLLNGLAAFFPDPRIAFRTVFFTHCLPTMLGFLRSRLRAPLACCHDVRLPLRLLNKRRLLRPAGRDSHALASHATIAPSRLCCMKRAALRAIAASMAARLHERCRDPRRAHWHRAVAPLALFQPRIPRPYRFGAPSDPPGESRSAALRNVVLQVRLLG